MATRLTTSTLRVTIEEDLTLNGVQQGTTNVLTIPSIAEVSKRIINVPTSEVGLLAMSTAVAAGAYVESDVRYIRITNLDSENFVSLLFKNENNDEFAVKLDYGQSFIYNADLVGGVVDTMDAVDNAGLTPGTFGDLVTITAMANTAAVDLEFFVASA